MLLKSFRRRTQKKFDIFYQRYSLGIISGLIPGIYRDIKKQGFWVSKWMLSQKIFFLTVKLWWEITESNYAKLCSIEKLKQRKKFDITQIFKYLKSPVSKCPEMLLIIFLIWNLLFIDCYMTCWLTTINGYYFHCSFIPIKCRRSRLNNLD